MEALYLAIGLRPVRAGLFHRDTEFDAGLVPEPGLVAGAVVTEHSGDNDPVTGEPGIRASPELGGGFFGFVGEDLGVGQPSSVNER